MGYGSVTAPSVWASMKVDRYQRPYIRETMHSAPNL